MNNILKSNAIRIAMALLILVALNLLSQHIFFRVDLTSEKRFTLAPVTKKFMRGLGDQVTANVYLSGGLNPGFTRLSKAAIEMLDELNVYAAHGIEIKQIDPSLLSKKEGADFSASLEESGLAGVPVFEATEDGRKTRTIVYPYILLQYDDSEVYVNLLDNLPGLSGDENLNRSIENIEYKIMDGLRRLAESEHNRIAFLEGNGELDEIDVVEAVDELSKYFIVDRGAIGTDASVLDGYKVVIVAKPANKFSESEKFVLDQYFMKGGRILWMVDAVTMTLDSLRSSSNTLGLWNDLNIDDMLFKYGIRINPEVVEDTQCGVVPISVSQTGQQPRIVPMPWRFLPLLSGNNLNPITRNINAVKGDFVSYIDTVGEILNVNRTILLRTSAYTKVNATPVFATLANIHQQPIREEFNRQFLPVAVLQSGVFPSVFTNRRAPQGLTNIGEQMSQSVPTQMIVVADGDIVRNDVRFRDSAEPRIIPLGYDEMSKQTFGNKDFIVNAVQYLADDAGWMNLRNRNFTLRLLDKQTLSEGTLMWKVIAVALPLLIILIFGALFVFIRMRKYGKY